MAKIEVRDRSIWTKHIHGDPELARRLEGLEAGATIELHVAGTKGLWEKMRQGAAGAPTPGLKPLGEARLRWTKLFQTRRGALVDLSLANDARPMATVREEPLAASEREAAWEAFKALTRAGWSSESGALSRDELHDR